MLKKDGVKMTATHRADHEVAACGVHRKDLVGLRVHANGAWGANVPEANRLVPASRHGQACRAGKSTVREPYSERDGRAASIALVVNHTQRLVVDNAANGIVVLAHPLLLASGEVEPVEALV